MNDKFPEIITTKDAAKALKVHPSTITRLIKAGVLKATKRFGDWRIDARDFRRLIEKELNRPLRGAA